MVERSRLGNCFRSSCFVLSPLSLFLNWFTTFLILGFFSCWNIKTLVGNINTFLIVAVFIITIYLLKWLMIHGITDGFHPCPLDNQHACNLLRLVLLTRYLVMNTEQPECRGRDLPDAQVLDWHQCIHWIINDNIGMTCAFHPSKQSHPFIRH